MNFKGSFQYGSLKLQSDNEISIKVEKVIKIDHADTIVTIYPPPSPKIDQIDQGEDGEYSYRTG